MTNEQEYKSSIKFYLEQEYKRLSNEILQAIKDNNYELASSIRYRKRFIEKSYLNELNISINITDEKQNKFYEEHLIRIYQEVRSVSKMAKMLTIPIVEIIRVLKKNLKTQND